MESLCHVPCGYSLPIKNPHAISVSLPTIDDVIQYELRNEALLSKLESAYPRFYMNRFVKKACEHIKLVSNFPASNELLPVSSSNVSRLIEKALNIQIPALEEDEFTFLLTDKESPDLPLIKSFIQHTGLIPSSRKAEDFLLRQNILQQEFKEDRISSHEAEATISKILSDAYGNSSEENIFLCNSGMNATYSVFEALKRAQLEKGKTIFIQLGWLYMDTMEIIKKYSTEYEEFVNVSDLDILESYLERHHSEVAAVFTEIPNNPQIQTVDLVRLKKMSQKFNFPIVIDSTLGTPFNVEILEFADIAVESLTKFASGGGDVLMGAIILKNESQPAQEIKAIISKIVEKPFIKDVQRLAKEILGYEERVKHIAANTTALVSYLKSNKKISKIFWALEEKSLENFNKIKRHNDAVPGTISLTFGTKLQQYYDALRIPKGPSFGTEFTLGMAYVYLAHYDLVNSETGRKILNAAGIDPELLRISVGTEPIEDIIKVFEEL